MTASKEVFSTQKPDFMRRKSQRLSSPLYFWYALGLPWACYSFRLVASFLSILIDSTVWRRSSDPVQRLRLSADYPPKKLHTSSRTERSNPRSRLPNLKANKAVGSICLSAYNTKKTTQKQQERDRVKELVSIHTTCLGKDISYRSLLRDDCSP
jgi:hypothetical protein